VSDKDEKRQPSSPGDIKAALSGGVPMGRWKEGLLFDGIEPTPGIKSAANWFPRTETLGPDEMRIIFMGTAPFIRPGQMNTSIFVQLGNGENFVFDIGEGCIANYIAGGFALNELDKIFITHLHVDHFGALPYCRTSTCSAAGQGVGTSHSRSTGRRAARRSTARPRWSRA